MSNMLPRQIMSQQEVISTLQDLRRKMLTNPQTEANLITFRLAACCGLRRCEICGINIEDVTIDGDAPCCADRRRRRYLRR